MGLAEGKDSVGQPSLQSKLLPKQIGGHSFDVFVAASVFVVMIVDVVLLSIASVMWQLCQAWIGTQSEFSSM